MTGSKKRYDSKHKVTRIFLADYLALKRISQLAGTSMAEALHRLIEHQAQLPLLDMKAKPMPVIVAKPKPTFRVTPPLTVIAVNGNKAGIFVVKPKGGILND